MIHHTQIGKFKAHCLQLMANVNKTKIPLVVTKHNVPLVKIIPIEEEIQPLFGYMKGSFEVSGDLIEPIDEAWDADC